MKASILILDVLRDNGDLRYFTLDTSVTSLVIQKARSVGRVSGRKLQSRNTVERFYITRLYVNVKFNESISTYSSRDLGARWTEIFHIQHLLTTRLLLLSR